MRRRRLSDLLAAQSLDLGDYFSFAIEGEGPIDLGDSAPSNPTIKRLFSHCLDVLEAEARRLIAQVLDADGGILFAVSHTREAPAAKSVQNRPGRPLAPRAFLHLEQQTSKPREL